MIIETNKYWDLRNRIEYCGDTCWWVYKSINFSILSMDNRNKPSFFLGICGTIGRDLNENISG